MLTQVCTGESAAGFFEARVAQAELTAHPDECASTALRIQTIADLHFQAGLASTFEAADAVDLMQREIDGMFRDGTLAVLIAEYSYFGLDDAWASYERVSAEQRWRWLTWGGSGLVLVSGIALWLAGALRQRKQAEAALRDGEETLPQHRHMPRL